VLDRFLFLCNADASGRDGLQQIFAAPALCRTGSGQLLPRAGVFWRSMPYRCKPWLQHVLYRIAQWLVADYGLHKFVAASIASERLTET